MLRKPLTMLTRRQLMRWVVAIFVLGALISEATAQGLVLERVVLVSRHGVRAPTNSSALADYTISRTWPAWPVVADADLTARGEELASLMGAFYRQHFAALGLLPAAGCPAPNQAYVWTDVDQRTRRTGNALLAGAFPDCGIYAQHQVPTDKPDALFHPVKAGVCKIDVEIARAQILQRAGGSLDAPLKTPPYQGSLARLQSVLDCCKPKLCKAESATCDLAAVRSELVEKDGGLSLSGPISIGSTASEVFLLEYAQGMPQVAWGGASTPDRIRSLLELHGLYFDLMQRTEHLAKRQGSALVYQVIETLRQTAERRPIPGMRPLPDGRFTIFVGHDTNLANIGAMLGVQWWLTSYLPNETPPAGAMAFELLREAPSGQYYVRMRYLSQTPDQMRSLTVLSEAHPPDRATIRLPCGRGDGLCSWPDFTKLAARALDMDCVIPTPR